MEKRVVSSLEREIEKAIAEVIIKKGLKRLPLLPSQQTMHQMAKAAVSVYEAVAEASVEGEYSNTSPRKLRIVVRNDPRATKKS